MSDDLKTVEEVAKATAEVAKTTGKAIDAGRELGQFLSKYTGGTLEQVMGIVEDKLKYLRWERQIRLIDRANKFLAERGLPQPSRNVPLHIAIPLIQGGSLEENDQLQDRWALLLTNAADASAQIEIRRAFISIMEDLTPFDAQLLEKIYSVDQVIEKDEDVEIWTTFLPDYATANKPDKDVRPSRNVEVSLGNMGRLGLVSSALTWGGLASHSCISTTVLGREFMKATSFSYTRN